VTPPSPDGTANPLLDLAVRPIIAHRGASADAPENTLEAFHLAVEQGCDAFELDVRLTLDGEAVLMHDPTLQRTCGHPGEVAGMSLAEVQAADAGRGFVAADGSRPWPGRGVRPPTLREVVRAFPEMPLLIELKVAEAQEAVARVLGEERALARCVVASFRPHALEQLRGGPVHLGADRRDAAALVVRTRLRLPVPRPRCLLYAVPWRWKDRIEVPKQRFIDAARRHGRPVHVWTVDDPIVARELWRRGASGIITNRPGLMMAVRSEK
jgi:glycerophosphoryl diester phosphodiesterase